MNDEVSKTKEELIKRIKLMPVDELMAYKSAANNTSRIINIIGISCIFFLILFPTLLVIIPCSIFVYMLANLSIGVDITRSEIRTALEKFDK